jgi:hypoxia induced protein
MQTLLNIAIAIACIAVVVVLFLGLWNMIRRGDGNTSQKLMRLRVIAQAIAIILLMGALFFFGGGNRG